MSKTAHPARFPAVFLLILCILSPLMLPAAAENVPGVKTPGTAPSAGEIAVFPDGEDAGRWSATSGTPVRDNASKTTGEASLALTVRPADIPERQVRLSLSIPATDLSLMDVLELDFSCTGTDAWEALSVTLSSSGSGTEQTLRWVRLPSDMTNASGMWRRLTLPIEDAARNQVDLTRINYLEISLYLSEAAQDADEITLRTDRLIAWWCNMTPVSLHSCDTTQMWYGDAKLNIHTDTENKQEGDAALFLDFHSDDISRIVTYTRLTDPIDGRNMKYLEFDLYLSDATLLSRTRGLVVEITSSGRCDAEERNWVLNGRGISVKNGWNRITLPLSDSKITGGDIRPDAVNYFRIYLLDIPAGEQVSIGLDNIRLLTKAPFSSEPLPEFPAEPDKPTDPTDPTEPTDPAGPGTPGTPTDSEGPKDGNPELTAKRAKILALVLLFAIAIIVTVAVALRTRASGTQTHPKENP